MNKYLCLISILFPVHLFAQEADSLLVEEKPHYDILQELGTESHNGGQATVESDSSTAHLLQWHIHLNEKKQTFAGYRIQIHSVSSFGSDIENLKAMRDKFEETFRDIPAYLEYYDPDFKIRAGNYRNRLECIPDLHRIRKIYPASYAVKTEISLDELKRIPMQDIVTETETAEE